jgi:hypothetical protein
VSPSRAAASMRSALLNADEARLVAGAEFLEDRLDRGPVLGEVAVRGVDDLHEHVGARDFLQRGSEGVYELVGQLVDETHRVGDDGRLAVAQLDLARRGVERGEEPVLGLDHDLADEALSSVDLPALV